MYLVLNETLDVSDVAVVDLDLAQLAFPPVEFFKIIYTPDTRSIKLMSLFVIYVLINSILLLRLTRITSETIGRKWNNLKFTRQ